MENNNKEPINLGGFNDLIQMRDGWMVYNKNDKYIGKSIKEYGEWSQGELDLCKQVLSSTDVVIEVGSNIGSHTIPLAKTVHQGSLYAFEPQNVVFQNLCANIYINSITNCFCYNSALSDKKDEEFYYPNYDFTKENNFAGMSLVNEKKSKYFQRARIDTLDHKFLNLPRLNLLKIDAEGMELNVFKGGIDLINKTKPFLFFENNGVDRNKSKELIELIFSLGYRLFWHISFLYNRDNFFHNQVNYFGKTVSSNMFGVQKDLEITVPLPEATDSSFHPVWDK